MAVSFFEKYVKLDKLGEGTYGVVYKALDTEKNKTVAMKILRLDQESEGISATTLREISILQSMDHVNIVNLVDQYIDDTQLVIIEEYLDMDIRKLMHRTKKSFETNLQQSYAYQLLSGLYYLHTHRVIHRDVKPDNLLIDAKGYLKICDFGLSRFFTIPIQMLTPDLVTLWYRPPELLLHNDYYEVSVDIWSAGCVLAELAMRKPLFPGDSNIAQIHAIFNVLGTPDKQTLSYFKDFSTGVTKVPQYNPTKLESIIQTENVFFIDLLYKLLEIDPRKRITAKEALKHPYFNEIDISIKRRFTPDYDYLFD